MNAKVSSRSLVALVASPVFVIAVPVGAQPPSPGGAPPSNTSAGSVQSQRNAALDAALGLPPSGAQPDPSTAENPGWADRSSEATVEQSYGSTATTVAPDGSLINGLQMYDADLAPTESGYLDELPEEHIVQPGDTLWDVSAYYLADPYLWPKLWSWNEHITNPHWVFPGDRVRLYDPTQDRSRVQEVDPLQGVGETSLPGRARQDTYVLNQAAFISKQDFETAMKVTGGAGANVMMASLDTIYLDYDKDNPPIPGERLVAYAPTEEVKSLKGNKTIGYVVQLMGEVEINAVAREAAEGTVVGALNPIERGYRVGPLRRVFRRVRRKDAERSATGQVIATLTTTGPVPIKIKRFGRETKYYNLADDELFVIVDLGKDEGLEVGNILEVVRKGDGYTEKRIFDIPYEDGWPRRVLAALLVVEVEDETALCATVFARREFERGDHVELRGPGLTETDRRTRASGGMSAGGRADGSIEDDGARGKAGFKVGGGNE